MLIQIMLRDRFGTCFIAFVESVGEIKGEEEGETCFGKSTDRSIITLSLSIFLFLPSFHTHYDKINKNCKHEAVHPGDKTEQ